MPENPDGSDPHAPASIWPQRIWRGAAMTAAIAIIGSTGGLMLGRYAVGDADLSGTRLEAATTVAAPGAGSDSVLTADFVEPVTINCTGCGPGIREIRAMEERDRIERMIAAGRDDFPDYAADGDGTGYGHDAFGNIYYEDISKTAPAAERMRAAEPSPVIRTREVSPIRIATAPAPEMPIRTAPLVPVATELRLPPVSVPSAADKD